MSKQTTDSYLDPASEKQNLQPFAPPEPFSHSSQLERKATLKPKEQLMCAGESSAPAFNSLVRTDWNQGNFFVKTNISPKLRSRVLEDWSFILCATWQSPDAGQPTALPPPDFTLNSHRGITETRFTITRTWAKTPHQTLSNTKAEYSNMQPLAWPYMPNQVYNFFSGEIVRNDSFQGERKRMDFPFSNQLQM